MPLISSLFITRMGFYPKAQHHYYQRPTGILQAILLYCTGGQGWIQLPKNRVALRAGEVFVIPKGTPHAYGADAENSWTIYWFHLSGHQCEEAVMVITGEAQPPTQALRMGLSVERTDLFDRMFDAFLGGYSTANLLYANLTLSFFLASFVLPENFRRRNEPTAPSTPTDRAIQFMQAHLAQSLTVDAIAESAHLSVSFFSRKFKQATGYAPIEYFNHLRIQKACQLLHFGDARINEVASQIGIDDPFYFSRLFKKQMGVSPAQYRKGEGIPRRP